jgi:hypothetical protein
VIFELAEMPGEGNVFGAREILVAEKENLVLQKQRADLGYELRVARSDSEVHVGKLGTDRAGEWLDLDRGLQCASADDGRCAGFRGRLDDFRHEWCLLRV